MRSKHSSEPFNHARLVLVQTFLKRSTKMLERVTSAASSEALKTALSSPTDVGGVASLLSDLAPLGIDLSALYLFYDGEPYNIDPLGGYVGLNGHDFDIALLGLVASLKNTDNFDRAGGNLPIIGYPTTPLTSLTPLLYHISTP